MNDLVIMPTRAPSPELDYTRDLAKRLAAHLPFFTLEASEYEVIISVALRQISRDIAGGRIVPLEQLGEFIKIDNYGPGIRYQADRKLLQSCAIETLKTLEGEQHANN